ncbi:MAG: NAD(+) synthase [Anaerolineales bacterium]|jgi:NAD+ synthase
MNPSNLEKESILVLTKDVFNIDCKGESEKIEAFIHAKMDELHREGIVVAISGGLDSSTVVGLCVRAVGKQKVTGLNLPEKNGNPDALKFSQLMAGSLGFKTNTIDISKILAEVGTYKFVADRIGSRALINKLIKKFPQEAKKVLFMDGIKGTKNSMVRQAIASTYSKHRIRLVVTYKYAEENNLLVVGCAHKSEDLLGLFSKFGVDDNADVMPIKHLFRSQILQIASYIGVPQVIIQRTPNPDMFPGVEDKYFDVIGIPSDILDLVLYGLEHSLSTKEIASQLHLDPGKVQELKELVRLTAHMRNHSMSLIN